MTTHTSATGFGDVRFRVLVDASTRNAPDWRIAPALVTRHIPGSNLGITQHMGTPPATLTLRCAFDDTDTYREFARLVGTTATLTVLAGFMTARGTERVEHGRAYDDLDDVLLADIERVEIEVDGGVECTATFLRAIDPLTGLAATE